MRYEDLKGTEAEKIEELKQYLNKPRRLMHNEIYDEFDRLQEIKFYQIGMLWFEHESKNSYWELGIANELYRNQDNQSQSRLMEIIIKNFE